MQTLEVSQLAKTAYLTGGKVNYKDGGSATALSKLGDLGFAPVDENGNAIEEVGTINIKAGGKEFALNVTANTTVSDVLNRLKDAGLNASFDAKNQRFFVSAKESGVASDFSITASDAVGNTALKALGLQTALDPNATADKMDPTTKEYMTYASYYDADDRAATIGAMQSLIDKTVESKVKSYLSQYESLVKARDNAQEKVDEINAKYADSPLDTVDNYTQSIKEKTAAAKTLAKEIAAMEDGDEKVAKEAELLDLNEEIEALEEKKADAQTLATPEETLSKIADVEKYINVTATTGEDGKVTYTAEATAELVAEVEDSYYDKAKYASEYIADVKQQIADGTYEASATKVSGQDAIIRLNGAEFTNTSNVFEINGLTITALSETEPGKAITLTTQDDVEGIYDMVKNFLKEYNTLISEMDKLYNADAAKDYEPLTDEEKEALSETEVEKYEKKIKDALLRRDSNLNSVSAALKEAMSAGYEVNGRKMYLADFGINTLGYFTAADNEKNMYHIDGDKDDSATSGNADKLKSLISTDSDSVISFFSALSQNLYDKMTNLSKSVNGYRSFGNFYDDKKLKTDYKDYTSKIASLEEKLADYEDKWYAKFAAMETAMAKMQSNTNAIAGLLGG